MSFCTVVRQPTFHFPHHLGYIVHPVFNGIENPELKVIHLLLRMNHKDDLDGHQQHPEFQGYESGQKMCGEFQDEQNQDEDEETDIDPVVIFGKAPPADTAENFFQLLTLPFELFDFSKKLFPGFITVTFLLLDHDSKV